MQTEEDIAQSVCTRCFGGNDHVEDASGFIDYTLFYLIEKPRLVGDQPIHGFNWSILDMELASDLSDMFLQQKNMS